MIELQGPFAITAAVLVVSGVLKLADPDPTGGMLRALRLPASRVAVVAVALVEVLLGVAGVVQGGRLVAVAVAGLYAAFAVVAALLLRKGDVSCGCFGSRSTRMSPLHLGVDLVALAIAVAAAVTDAPGFVDARPELPWAGLPQLGFILVGAALVVAVLTALPEALEAARPSPATAPVREFSLGGGR